MRFLSRLLERFGIVADTLVAEDCDEYIPPRPRADKFVPAARAARIASGEEPCPHLRETELLPTDTTVNKLFRCEDCGLIYRHVLKEGAPWLICGYQPVGAQR